MMNRAQVVGLILVVALLGVPSVAGVLATGPAPGAAGASALPASPWWLVLHNQCADTLHWVSPSGQFAAIPRPVMPNEAPAIACGARALHISQDGRYLVQVGALTGGRVGLGFYDLQGARWIGVYEAQPNELIYLGARYSSDSRNRIAVGFTNRQTAPRGWRVIMFDMTTAGLLQELRSDGPEIAGFVGGEFLATALTIPRVLLLAHDAATATDAIHIRFDGFEAGDEPLGAVAWYPAGAPGVAQKLISSPYRAQDVDLLPNGHAIYAYQDVNYPLGEPVGEVAGSLITTNAIAMLRPVNSDPAPLPQLYFADGMSTLYGAHWGADGAMALFWRASGGTSYLHWITIGTTVLIPLNQSISQVIGVPGGFVYSTADGVYYLSSSSPTPVGPVFTSPALSGGMVFVWASAFGNPPLALDTLASAAPGPLIVTATPPGPIVVTAPPLSTPTPDIGVCRLRSADGSNINIRTGPGTNYPVLGQLLGGSEAPVTGYNGQWYTVNFAGSQGWAAGWVVTLLGNCAALSFVAAPPTPVPTSPPPPTAPPPGPVIEFWADRTSLAAGECTNVNWRVEYIREVYFEGVGVVGAGSRNVCPAATTTYTLRVILTDGSTQTRTVTITVGGGGGQPDLYVSEFSLDPAIPVKGQPVNVRVGVYNQGTAAVSTSFHIEWYPGENYPAPACAWDLDSMAAHGGRILTCTYAGYPSPYGSINTMVKVDTFNTVAESNEGNNIFKQPVTVVNP